MRPTAAAIFPPAATAMNRASLSWSNQDRLEYSDKPSIAVLPFRNLSGDPQQEYFADGMVEEITTAIARIPWLSVIARHSAFADKGKAAQGRQGARGLG